MLILDLLKASQDLVRDCTRAPEVNPLVEDCALQEAQLLDVWIDALRGQAALLFELRMALQLRESNTGVLVAHGVREFTWSAPSRSTKRTAWSVGGSSVDSDDNLFHLRMEMWPSPGASLFLVAESALFVGGDVPGLTDAPPDYSGEDAGVREQLASWESPFIPTSTAFFDPKDARN